MKGIVRIIASLLIGVAAAKQPNVVVILVDDMGYGDIAAHGNPVIRTPHLDKLRAESVRLTDFHVDPTCSPTRAALMTGKYAHHVKVWHTIAGGNHLRESELTMADVFRANGYRTGLFGKWHLGSNLPYRPIDRGFDEWLGQGDGGTGTTDDHFLNDRVNDHYLHNGEWRQIDGWAPEVFFRAATDFARESRKQNKPFFTYLATYLPHHPHTLPDPRWADAYKDKVPESTAYFFTAIEKIDAQIGQLRAALARENLDRDTLILFLTDNGGTDGASLFNAGMRGRKGQVHDGGHRVPCFVHWPAGNLRHGQDIDTLHAHIDLLPTFLDLCDLKLPRPVEFDGRSFAKQLTDATVELPERTVFVELQRTFESKKWHQAVAMTEQWRLVNNEELHDIRQDPGQKQNVIAEHPQVVARLRADFDGYWQKVSPGDRERITFVIGDERDTETFLHPSDWYLPMPPWHHARVAAGANEAGDWRVRTASAGTYRWEIRRWPREADALIAGVPVIRKTVDAWDAKGPKPDLIYGNSHTLFKALPVSSVRLTVGDVILSRAVEGQSKMVSFDIPLEKDRTLPVKAEFLDAQGGVISGGYYMYARLLR